jgi:phage tail sheath protein FI
MAQYKTRGVYVVEKNAFPNSVVEVATAVPAFIGYTEFADNKGTSLAKKAWRITSMAEFHAYYGAAPISK